MGLGLVEPRSPLVWVPPRTEGKDLIAMLPTIVLRPWCVEDIYLIFPATPLGLYQASSPFTGEELEAQRGC